MMNWYIALPVTVLIIVASAFFVVIEFSLLAARRNRLEETAESSASSRAALRSLNELTIMLAGAQLGITAATFALGAITKPWVHHLIEPAFGALPDSVGYAVSFALSLFIVTFLHLVVGEMAPKSWAIAHPERSATMLAIPMRGFMWLTRPLLRVLNNMANWLLVKVGVEPSDQVGGGQDAAALRHLVEHSADVGSLDAAYSAQLTGALEMQTATVGALLRHDEPVTAVGPAATPEEIRTVSRRTGHLRILVLDEGLAEGVVHVRDTLLAADDDTAATLMRPILELAADTPVHAALASMRESRAHLAVVLDGGEIAGVITLADVLARLFESEGSAA